MPSQNYEIFTRKFIQLTGVSKAYADAVYYRCQSYAEEWPNMAAKSEASRINTQQENNNAHQD